MQSELAILHFGHIIWLCGISILPRFHFFNSIDAMMYIIFYLETLALGGGQQNVEGNSKKDINECYYQYLWSFISISSNSLLSRKANIRKKLREVAFIFNYNRTAYILSINGRFDFLLVSFIIFP